MSKIHRALGSVPARPAVYIAIALILGVVLYRYGTEYAECSAHADLRDRLHDAVEQAAAAGGEGRVVLADVATFDWQRVDIETNFKPEIEVPGCSFGWDWSAEERDVLVAAGLLTVLVFSDGRRIVDYLETRSDWGDFRDITNPYARDTAVFSAVLEGEVIVLRPVAAR